MVQDTDLKRIFNNLTRRIQHIGIALRGQRIRAILPSGSYDLTRTDTPSIGEVEDAFRSWNYKRNSSYCCYYNIGKRNNCFRTKNNVA